MSPLQSAFPGVQLGSIHISYFGLIIVAATITGGIAVWRSVSRLKDALDVVVDLVMVSFISSLMLGRLGYILAPPPSVEQFYSRDWYLSHVSDLLVGPLAIWSGGLDAGGLFIGALLGARIVTWRRQIPLNEWENAISLGFVLFLAVAPLANLVNSQQMGPPTSLPWGVPIEHRFAPIDDFIVYPPNTRFHPTPGYVSLWALAVLTLLPIAAKRLGFYLANGQHFIFRGLVLLPGLFAADFIRLDVSRPLLDLTALQCFAAVLWIVLLAKAFIHGRIEHSQALNI